MINEPEFGIRDASPREIRYSRWLTTTEERHPK